MITDTAPFRYPYYHTWEDTVDKIDFEKLARVTYGISKVIRDFVGLEGQLTIASLLNRAARTFMDIS